MKEFNLEEAINGKAFYLHDGYRGVIKYCVDDFITSSGDTPLYPYIGYVLDDKGFIYKSLAAWDKNGKSNIAYSYNATTMVDDTPPQDNKEETMKKFDLKAALSGEPVKLRNGSKAIILNDARNYFKNTRPSDEVLLGLISDVNNQDKFLCSGAWASDGSWINNFVDEFDIVEMWEEPKISIEDLPKPFKPKDGESYFYITGGIVEYEDDYWDSNKFDKSSAERGGCYRTREDAQKWLDFMKSMME